MKLEVGSRSDVGCVRKVNEDALGMSRSSGTHALDVGELFLVADGMGGHTSGEVASRLAVESVLRLFGMWTGSDARSALMGAVERANAEIYARGGDEQFGPARMGTTLVGALVRGNELHVVNVGDSRAYRLRSGRLEQLSRDHSVVADQVAKGLIGAEEARQLVYRNRITRALGQKPTVVVDYFVHTWQAGDVLILCTDGLTGQMSDAEIAAVVSRGTPDEAAARLVELANERGGPDNISVIVARAEPDALGNQAAPPRPNPQPAWKRWNWLWPFAFMALAAVALVALIALVTLLGLIPLTLNPPGLPKTTPAVLPIKLSVTGEPLDAWARDLGYATAPEMIQQGRLQGTTLTVSPRRPGLLIAGRLHEIETTGQAREFQATIGSATYSVTCPTGGTFNAAVRVREGDVVSVLGLIEGSNRVRALVVDVSRSKLGGLSAEWVNWYQGAETERRWWVYTVAGGYTIGDASAYGIREGDPALVYAQWKTDRVQIVQTTRLGKLDGDYYTIVP
jgi:serine/threonine protein phosphatase PrpC